jgi:maltooligosyltrehalose trehalohydrolase
MTGFLLLMPGIPLLFQGQEFAASTPFLYFADFQNDLGRSVRQGRRSFLAQFPSLESEDMQARLGNPADPETFRRSQLDNSERERHTEAYALHHDLLALRRDDLVLGCRPCRAEGAVISENAWLLRYTAMMGQDRLLIVNLGADLPLAPIAEPLLAPVARQGWRLLWSSEDPRYGGSGIPLPSEDSVWHVPGQSALLLASDQRAPRD